MRVKLGLFFLAFALCTVDADIETCTELSDCSDVMKQKCDDMSKEAEKSDADQKLYAVLACKNGICMCNVQFPGATDTPPSDEPQKRAEEPTTESSEPST